MTKHLFALLLMLAASLCLPAQEPATKSFIGLAGGYAHAFGNFTKSNYNDNTSGYANASGYNLGIEGAYYFHKYIGVGGVLSSHAFATSGLQSLVDGYKDAFDVDSAAVTVNGVYRTYNVLIGPYFSLPIKKFTIDVRVLGGLVNAGMPKYKVDLEDQANATFYQQASRVNTFGWQAGVGLRYALTDVLCVKLNADYYYADPNFKIENQNRLNNAGRLLTAYKQPIACIQLNAGIAYQFGK